MRITLERSAFLKSLTHVQSVVERRNTIPILANIMLQADKGRLSLTATDLDIEIVESVSADVVRSGAITAPAHTLYDIVRKLPEGAQVQLDHATGDPRLTLSAGRSRFQLACLPRDEFPAMAAGDLLHQFALTPKDLSALIGKTRFAVSTEETRYYLNGIYLHAHKDKGAAVLRGVATDGHRLARFELAAPRGALDMPGVIIPRKTIAEASKLAEDAEGQIEIAVSETKIRFTFGAVVVTSKLIDGTFPDYQRVIPTANDKILDVGRQELQEAVDRVATVSSEKSRAVKLNLESGKLTLTVISPESGTATEELFVEYKGEPLEIGFNARYLLDILERIESPTARVFFADGGSPAMVREATSDASLFVLMPMRV